MVISLILTNLSAGYFLSTDKIQRVIILTCGSESMTLPVTPWKYTVSTSQNNKLVDILDFGEALLFGNAKLKKLKFSCFFPNQERHIGHKYVVDNTRSPEDCIDLIIKWKESKKPIRVIITNSPVNLMMGIMDFSYYEKDGSRDIWYDISFNEYKDLNTPPANNNRQIDKGSGLKNRADETVQEDVTVEVNSMADYVNNT